MQNDKKNEFNPVARLRELYFERRKIPKLTENEREAFRKDKEKHDKIKKDEQKIAREISVSTDWEIK